MTPFFYQTPDYLGEIALIEISRLVREASQETHHAEPDGTEAA